MTNDNALRVEIPGRPIAKRRHRVARSKTGKPISYSDQGDQVDITIAHIYKEIGPKFKPLDGALSVEYCFYFTRPKSHFNVKGELKTSAPFHYTKLPDLDNLVKYINDCFNGFVWVDDKQVVKETAAKRYSSRDMTIVKIIQY